MMSKLFSYLCCCLNNKPKKNERRLQNINNESKSKKKSYGFTERPSAPTFNIPEEYQNVDECMAANKFKIKYDMRLGKGGYGVVYGGIDLRTNKEIACKFIELSYDKSQRRDLKNELEILKSCQQNENIIQLFDHFIIKDSKRGSEYCYVFMELANGGTVLDKMKTKDGYNPLSKSLVKNYLKQMVNGLHFLHTKMKVSHKDLKLTNVLISTIGSTEVIKLSDFGISRIRFDEKTGQVIKDFKGVGTDAFMSPQILKIHIYKIRSHKVGTLRYYDSFMADCWALGVCLFVMISAELPFAREDESTDSYINIYKQMIKKDPKNRYHISEKTESKYGFDCIDLINQLLEPFPPLRIDIRCTKDHPFIRK